MKEFILEQQSHVWLLRAKKWIMFYKKHCLVGVLREFLKRVRFLGIQFQTASHLERRIALQSMDAKFIRKEEGLALEVDKPFCYLIRAEFTRTFIRTADYSLSEAKNNDFIA